MNALQQFIAARPCGFITKAELPALVAMDRLCPLLVRCGACRFTCAAQDVAHLIRAVDLAGDYVRDVSFPVGSIEAAADWAPEPQTFMELPKAEQRQIHHEERRHKADYPQHFNEADCGGVFDGFSVSSDADPGL